MDLAHALEGYWLEKRRGFSKHTISEYEVTFRRLVAFLGEDIELGDITGDHIRRFLEHVTTSYGLAPKSLSNVWTALSSFWTWAEIELQVTHVIRGHVKRPQYRRQPIQPYTQTEIAAMLESCGHKATWTSRHGRQVQTERQTQRVLRDRAIIMILVDSGIRAQELCDLTLEDYDSKAGHLHIRHGKGNKARYVYLGESTRKALWRYLATRGKPAATAALLATSNNTHLDRDGLRHSIERCATRAGVEHANVHRFRHTFAIWFLRNGGSVLELQHLLGHEKLDTVHIYATLAQTDLASAHRKASPADNWRLG